MKINIYLGFSRIPYRVKYKITKDIFIESKCFECNGTGIWDFYPDDYPFEKNTKCTQCKGTGINYYGTI